MHDDHLIKTVGDVAAASISVLTIANWLPAIAAAFSILWTAIRIYEWVKAKLA